MSGFGTLPQPLSQQVPGIELGIFSSKPLSYTFHQFHRPVQ